MAIIAMLVAAALAFANGANDNGKGVATLIGSKVMRLRPAILYAAITTLAGSVTAIWIGADLILKFKGKGVVEDALLSAPAFPISVAFGAAGAVLLATRLAMPISTTHAMVGSIVGIGLAGRGLIAESVWSSFFYPLLASPLLAMASSVVIYLLFRTVKTASGVSEQSCLCVGRAVEPVSITNDGAAVLISTGVELTIAQQEQCEQRYIGRFLGVDAHRALNAVHVLSAGALSFARGLNDTPKIAAVMLPVAVASPMLDLGHGPVLLTGVAIAVGGVLAVRRVAQTVSCRITGMSDGQAFSASLNAAILVIFASRLGLPVSTTHVTCGSLFGIGLVNKQARWTMIGKIIGAWVITLPVAAGMGALAWLIFNAALGK